MHALPFNHPRFAHAAGKPVARRATTWTVRAMGQVIRKVMGMLAITIATLLGGGWSAVSSAASVPGPTILEHFRTIGPQIDGSARLAGPFGVSVSRRGDVLLSDDLGHRVYHLNHDLEIIRTFGATIGLAYTDAAWQLGDGSYIIADTGKNRLLWLDATGRESRSVSRLGWFRGKLANPRSVVPVPLPVSGQGWLVADWGNRCVRLLDAQGALLRTYGGPEPAQGALQAPIDAIWLRGQGVVVSDHRGHRLVRYAPDGTLGKPIGHHGSGPGELDRPGGLALAPDGTVWVSEMGNARLQRFTLDGTSVGIYHGPPEAPLGRPTDLAFGPGARLFVADAEHHVLYVYDVPPE